MVRWILIAVSAVALLTSFRTDSPGMLALLLFLALGTLFAAVLLFAAARVDSVSQGQSSRELSLMLDARKPGKSGSGGVHAGVGVAAGHHPTHDHESATTGRDRVGGDV